MTLQDDARVDRENTTSTSQPSTLSSAWNWTLRSLGLSSKPTTSRPQPEEPTPTIPRSDPVAEKIHIAPEVWENPYHPLPGPPTTPAERDCLQKIIQEEREALASAVAHKLAPHALQITARNNCADLNWAYADCLRNGSWMERSSLCSEKNKAFKKCFQIQQRNLEKLGYGRPGLTERERAIIADQADQKYLEEIEVEKLEAQTAETGI
ncbi:uncharacterized protein SPPG_05638 [Spizellomyces punctatus DAOM BR117]|uniref:Uncharacterized protein n=1 Tax=Spizellomyces punctatus (strain DAOM BR117) TaxID=645134 RepID=A0A0L0HD16_SPIPD|nr:uncharacterized protein SPPG_05638 [Spizellomyces punctatus DAOM BR117]KNC99395.1 hypothetical protein SPPG_05638 [Spizellomyces punctatus DAOM BR117]|eukprot:XP_016607435.1 hypothetical protein SPPG_05638 [Spizellomyces punctatus DAOM BR117]